MNSSNPRKLKIFQSSEVTVPTTYIYTNTYTNTNTYIPNEKSPQNMNKYESETSFGHNYMCDIKNFKGKTSLVERCLKGSYQVTFRQIKLYFSENDEDGFRN